MKNYNDYNEPMPCPKGTKCKKCKEVLYHRFSWNTGNEDTYYVTCKFCAHKEEYHYKK